LKQSLRINEDSEILLRIFKLYNLFYEKFNKDKLNVGELMVDEDRLKDEDAITNIKTFFNQNQVSNFTNRVSDILRIIYKTNIDINDSVSNLILSVFLSFYPEIYLSIQNEEKMIKEQQEKPNADKSKYKIRMLPLSDSTSKH
jgi:hypothetical protein